MKTDERLGIGCGPGWFPLIIETDRRLSDLDPGYQVVQLKAKWGELRYYIQTSPSAPDETRGEMFNVTKQALERSRHICEHCGGPIEVEITETGGTSTWGCPRCFGDRGCRTDWPGRP